MRSIAIVTALFVSSHLALADGHRKEPHSTSTEAGKKKVVKKHKATPTPSPYPEGLTSEQADAIDQIPSAADVPYEQAKKEMEEFERRQKEEATKAKRP
jgi:hypothetical protein